MGQRGSQYQRHRVIDIGVGGVQWLSFGESDVCQICEPDQFSFHGQPCIGDWPAETPTRPGFCGKDAFLFRQEPFAWNLGHTVVKTRVAPIAQGFSTRLRPRGCSGPGDLHYHLSRAVTLFP